jgi:hypothetical protein
MAKQRQEVFNVTLAQLLQNRGVVAAPENILYAGESHQRHMPDVIVNFQGLRTAIEGEIQAADARRKALNSAAHRVESGIAHIGTGVVYPSRLQTIEFSKLPRELERATLDIAVITEAGHSDFSSGNVDYLERILRSTFEQLVREDVVAESVSLLDAAVDRFADTVGSFRGIWGRITQELTGELPDKELETLSIPQIAANCRIGGLVLINAMIFHNILSDHYPRITPLTEILSQKRLDTFPEHWQYILNEINYFSIFYLARQIFLSLSSAVGVLETLTFMAQTAKKISERRVALRHDLMGRVYHRLLVDAKYLGTYYTSIPAAELLLKLALRPQGWSTPWEDAESVGSLRIADLACGTGTLLMAAADTILDNHVSKAAALGKPVALTHLHRQVAESVLHGYDVLPSAIHLTASTLALRSPDVPFKKMNLFSLPLGGKTRSLGSLEFLGGNLMKIPLDLSGAFTDTAAPQQVTGKAMQGQYTSLPDLDLCVMNPPFVRSVGGNLLFGSRPDDERAEMQARLKKLVKVSRVKANVTSGLGSVFVAVGDRHIKRGGRLALVLPKALLSGVSWAETRQLINQKYAIDYIIVSHDAEKWNFSDSTELSEALLVATKYDNIRPPQDHKTTIVNLWRNPTTALEALSIAAQITQAEPPDLVLDRGVHSLQHGESKAGEVVTMPWGDVKEDWFLPCAFAQADLTRSAYQLIKGYLRLPDSDYDNKLPLASLGLLGKLGPDRRDIYDGFNVTSSITNYPAFWGHEADKMLSIAQRPNKYLEPLTQAKDGRSLRKVSHLWPLAGQILLAERMWLKTQRLVAIRLDRPVLSNVWWSFTFESNIESTEIDKALVVWLNSTLAFTILLATRDETRGAWVDFKKPSLSGMPVLDVRALSPNQIRILAKAFDRISDKELMPLPLMESDQVRAEIDSAIAQALELPDFSILRGMLGREPVVCMKRLG